MSSDNPCTLTLPDGTHYDLSPLSSSSADYVSQVGDVSYKLNVCRAVVSELWKIDDPENVGGFVSRTGGDFSLGQVNSTLLLSPSTNEPMMYLSNGSPCPLDSQSAASTAIRFICSPSDFHAGKPVLVAALPPGDPANYCQFFFEWSTHVACPTNPKAEMQKAHYYIAFFAIFLIAFLTWFFGHTLYNRFYLKRRGLAQFPLPSFTFPKLSAGSIRNPFTRAEPSRPRFGFGRRSRAGYANVRADEGYDEEDGFAGRFSLEDDEDAEDLTGEGVQVGANAALGEETDAWRGAAAPGGMGRATNGTTVGGGGGHGSGKPKLGAHQGLVDI
ncbi:hypothetical protein JCM24511_00342 [Saitozyma sp. JCM 24511]|nr:hypothetical protein JCM24511_00342 [Saitozyma sp. JCM 24511]